MKRHNGTKKSIVDAFFDSFGIYNHTDDPEISAVVDYIFSAIAVYPEPPPELPESYDPKQPF